MKRKASITQGTWLNYGKRAEQGKVFVERACESLMDMSLHFFFGQFLLPLGFVVLDNAIDGAALCRVHLRSSDSVVLGYRSSSPRIIVDGHGTSKTLVGNIKNEVIKIVAVSWVAPTNQALVDIINIASEVWNGLPNQLDLWNVSENFGVGAKVDVLVGSLRLQE